MILNEILSQPTVPFRESHVIRRIARELDEKGVPYFQDPIGNVVVGAGSQGEYLKLLKKKEAEPLRIFIAHTDHPGFHGVEWTGERELSVKWHGGSPTAHLEGARVWLADESGARGHGHFRRVEMHPSGKALVAGTIEIDGESPGLNRTHAPKPAQLFGGFAFREPVWQEGRLLYTKAADDLVGCYAIVRLAVEAFAPAKGGKGKGTRPGGKKPRPPFIGLLTRAEEVGFIGAIGHFELGWFKQAKRELLFVSLETSRQLHPGAEIGKGPVVRLGDRYTVFDAGRLRVFTELAQKALPDAHQRRVMDGGTCEATVAVSYGYPSVGISVPLGNYHNQSFEGGPDSRGPNGPAPEFVSLDDVEGLVTLCGALLAPKLKWSDAFAAKRADFRKSLKTYRKLL
jgi:endoglucanase